jgi:hypothetical protein
MKHRKQKLITISGLTNGGKTVIFNLLRKENNVISLDISQAHYHIYRDEIFEQLGSKNAERLEKYIKTTDIFAGDIFTREIGRIMREFPHHHFVIKPGYHEWIEMDFDYKKEMWYSNVEKYMPIPKESMYHLFAVRHPRMGWITSNTYATNIEDFVNRWLTGYTIEQMKWYTIIKIEEISKNKLLRSLIKETDLEKVRTYTKFDLQVKEKNLEKNGFYNLEEEFKYVDKQLKELMKFLKYENEDENIDLFMNDELTEEEKQIDWLLA